MGSSPKTPGERISLHYYKNVLLSSIWIIFAFTSAGVVIAYLITRAITPTYMVTTTIMIRKENLEQSDRYDAIAISESFAQTYAKMITSDIVLEKVKTNIESDLSSEDLRTAITADHIIDTPFVEIRVMHSDRELAVKIADTVVDIFSSQVDASQQASATYQENIFKTQLQDNQAETTRLQDSITERSQAMYNQRLETINAAITNTRERIDKIDLQMAPLQVKNLLTRPERIELSRLETQKEELSSLLSKYEFELLTLTVKGPTLDTQDILSSQQVSLLEQNRQVYASLLRDYQNNKVIRAQNMIEVIQLDQPVLPDEPVRPNLIVNLLFGFVIGLLLSAVYVFVTKLGVD
ncbi:MAG TPA: GNVR domain-containing protein [Stenomitos sp.]